ncbi:tight adherence protein B [Candidatus Hakubella thermalkaliphila]|uniref:Tight adherence protein B n=1 Tax=Candidatus Hakubella thermalkaliphila TaxID=2754717 RepID=A0A6V8PAA0_9ACTN|nr:type II secretion system F family protein [Candidatus Hakubella thermalkaliphila]GFP18828.1 tight adherence protein B [Candidatus Hakubella thermalkaliphila]GFP29609.1 tight adherence protein B [Candidatus Hakubella thermalkaliphila]GFP39170.1 tight adherence protein B [Candidatus Hakubella thermalkaliphila]GFP41314.1 tight adherence protein B [Candidatus Hakubella thermalkaliphila]
MKTPLLAPTPWKLPLPAGGYFLPGGKTLIIGVLFFLLASLFPSLSRADEGDILIKSFSIEQYPQVDIYLGFQEDSPLDVEGLTERNFTISEDGQVVTEFSVNTLGQISEPIGVVLLIDTSGSMKGKPIANAIAAASLFVDQMREIDLIAVVGFADEVTTYTTFISDKAMLKEKISQLKARGETSLYDGIVTAADLFSDKKIKHRYIVVLSDGADTVSKLTDESAIASSLREKAAVYSIALESPEYKPEVLEKISKRTGAEILFAPSSEELEDLYLEISRKIENQYKIVYTSLWPNVEEIKVDLEIRRGGYSALTNWSYKNPFYVPAPTGFQRFQRPPFLTLFDNLYVRVAVYASLFMSVLLFLYIFVGLLFPARRKLKECLKPYSSDMELGEGNEYGEVAARLGPLRRISGFGSALAARRGFGEFFQLKLDRAGLSLLPSEFITLHLLSVVMVSFGTYFVFKNIPLTLLTIVGMTTAPFLLLSQQARSRIRNFHNQLPDALQILASSLRAGYSLNQALSVVVDEMGPPISSEFKSVLTEIRMGLPARDALESLARRINSEYMSWTIMAINIQREVGGNLAEVLETISDTIRERDRVLRQIKVLTAEGKISAYILIGLPVAVSLLLFLLNPDYIGLLFTTALGKAMLAGAVALMILGIIWMKRIVTIEY